MGFSLWDWLKRHAEIIWFGFSVFVYQVFILVIYAIWAGYSPDSEVATEIAIYPYFRDVNIMIFFGFGFLMTFLRRYGYSAISYSFLIAALVSQFSVILEFMFEEYANNPTFDSRLGVGVLQLLNGLFCSGAVLISFGAILGKTTPSQLVLIAFLEPVFYWLNNYVCILVLEAIDIGGGFVIHTFGCYFGLTLTLFLTSKKTKGHPDNSSCYSADIFSLAGTLFLWMMWPSFNAALATGPEQLRALVNTFLSLCGATVSTFFFSRWLSEGRFEIVHIQNSTLAGGVVMGVASHLNIYPASAIACGMVVGLVSVLGYRFLTPFLSMHLGIQDICGIHNLHGMPGVLGGILSIFATAGLAQEDPDSFPRGTNQAGYQTAALFITIGIALGGGLFTGALVWLLGYISKIEPDDYYNDRTFWQLPTDYEYVVDKHDDPDDETEMDEMDGGVTTPRGTYIRALGPSRPKVSRTGTVIAGHNPKSKKGKAAVKKEKPVEEQDIDDSSSSD